MIPRYFSKLELNIIPKPQAGFRVLLDGTDVWPRTVAFALAQFELVWVTTVVVVDTPVGDV